jgi:ergothioneine biosynthesis protein EgtB
MDAPTHHNPPLFDVNAGTMPRGGDIYTFLQVRQSTDNIVAPLSDEDMLLQSTPDTSPPKWHLAHTTWFFENFILREFEENFVPFHPRFDFLFNSYYDTLGEYLPKNERGHLVRPTMHQITDYRTQVEQRVIALLNSVTGEDLETIQTLIQLGMHHEMQHQELLLMDIKRNMFSNPLLPAYAPIPLALALHPHTTVEEKVWGEYPGGLVQIGADPEAGFSYDNEGGQHRVWIEPFQFSLDLVTNAEYMEFIEDGGYEDPALWLSDGWAAIKKNGWKHPLYWIPSDKGGFKEFTLYGVRELEMDEPVSHVSYYEAQAYAKWAESRLPTEFEWEYVSGLEGYPFHHGKLWEWTQSAYLPYPGYEPIAGPLEEYNGKFMCNQMVLRGGSFATPPGHYRHTYRNFYHPEQRWQFSGFRLARDV